METAVGTTIATHYFHFHPDHLSPRVTTDANGNVIGQQGHYPFGESWYGPGTTTKYQFTSYERDAESGNDYAQARCDINRLGRFSSPDPVTGTLGDPQSLNRYSYVRNMPITAVDPTGKVTGCPNVAENWTPSEYQNGDVASGPSGEDSGEPMLVEPPPTCAAFGSSFGGGGGVVLDGVAIDMFTGDPDSPVLFGGNLTSSNSAVQCPDNACAIVDRTTWTENGKVVSSYVQYKDFMAFADGVQGYFPYSGPGAFYNSAADAGVAAGEYFGAESASQKREFGGTITKDSEGFFSYSILAIGEFKGKVLNFTGTQADAAIWHTHWDPEDGWIGQFALDRVPDNPTPPNYVTTTIGSSFGTFLVGAWSGGGIHGLIDLSVAIEDLKPPKMRLYATYRAQTWACRAAIDQP